MSNSPLRGPSSQAARLFIGAGLSLGLALVLCLLPAASGWAQNSPPNTRNQTVAQANTTKPWTQEELALELSAVLDLRRSVSSVEASSAGLDLPATLLKFKTDALIMVIENAGDLLALDNVGAQYKTYVNQRFDRLADSLSRISHYQGLPSLASDARMVDVSKRIDARITAFAARLDAIRSVRR